MDEILKCINAPSWDIFLESGLWNNSLYHLLSLVQTSLSISPFSSYVFYPPPSLSLSFFILLQKKFSVFRTLFLKKISTHCLFQPITTAITIPILTFIFHLFHKECGFGKLHHYKMRSMRNDTVGPLLIFPRQNIISEDVSVSRLSFPSFH